MTSMNTNIVMYNTLFANKASFIVAGQTRGNYCSVWFSATMSVDSLFTCLHVLMLAHLVSKRNRSATGDGDRSLAWSSICSTRDVSVSICFCTLGYSGFCLVNSTRTCAKLMVCGFCSSFSLFDNNTADWTVDMATWCKTQSACIIQYITFRRLITASACIAMCTSWH